MTDTVYSMTAIFQGEGLRRRVKSLLRWESPNKDMVYSWKVHSRAPATWHVKPWESHPILIIGYQLVKLRGGGRWFMLGNSYIPDPIGFLGPDETSLQIWFPKGTGQPFPPYGTPNAYIDLHGSARLYTELALTIYYTRSHEHAAHREGREDHGQHEADLQRP